MIPYDADTKRTTRPALSIMPPLATLWPWYPHETRDAAVTHRHTSVHPPPPQDTPLQRFGATLRHYRHQQGLTQPVLAARLGIRYSYISEIELREAQYYRADAAHVLRVPWTFLPPGCWQDWTRTPTLPRPPHAMLCLLAGIGMRWSRMTLRPP